jgi:hypothetical protein
LRIGRFRFRGNFCRTNGYSSTGSGTTNPAPPLPLLLPPVADTAPATRASLRAVSRVSFSRFSRNARSRAIRSRSRLRSASFSRRLTAA